MGNYIGTKNIETQCKNLGYKKDKLVNKYISEKSKNYYKKKYDSAGEIKKLLQSRLLLTDIKFNKILFEVLNEDIYGETFKQKFITTISYINKKNIDIQKKYFELLVKVIYIKLFDKIIINKNSTRYKNTFNINDILTIYRYRLAITIYRYSPYLKIRQQYISDQFNKDIGRSYYYLFVDNYNKVLYANPYFKDHNFTKNPVTSENICNINLKIQKKEKLFNYINNNNSYDTKILNLLPNSTNNKNEIKNNKNENLNNIDRTLHHTKNKNNKNENLNNISRTLHLTKNKNSNLNGNLNNIQKNNLKILLLQNFLNEIITTIIHTFFDCSYSSKKGFGKVIYMSKDNNLIIYMCIPKCGINMNQNILPSGELDPKYHEKKHNKNYVIKVHLITGHMTIIQHDIYS